MRFLGAFLDEPAAVPSGVADHLAQQLGIPDAGCLTQYATARGRWLHSAEIKERHGYREFTDPAARFRLARWFYALCWTGTDRPSVLFDRATVWLVTEKVLLPGASALERLVARIRTRAARRLWWTLARNVTREQRVRLDALLIAGDGGRPSPLDRLRDGPYLRSGAELSRAIGRLDEVRVLTLDLPAIDHVPPGRVMALARFATVAKAQAVKRMPLERRTATLLAFVRTLEATAQDDVLDLFDIEVTTLFTDAAKVGKKARLRTIRDLDAAALQLRRAGGVLMDEAVKDDAVREAAFTIVPRAALAAALEQIDAIVRPPGDLYFTELRAQSGKLRFLPAMLRSVALGATPAGQPVMDAVRPLRSTDGRGPASSAPLGFVQSGWKRQVRTPDGGVDSLGYRLCLLDAMRIGVRRRDLFASPSLRYADPRIGLLAGPAWEAARPSICRTPSGSQPTHRPKSRGYQRVWTLPIGTPRQTCPRTRPCRWMATSWCFPPSTSWRNRPAWSHSRRRSPRACLGWTCPSCYWRCTPAPTSPTGSPMPARAAHGPAASPQASVPCCSPKRATRDSNFDPAR